MPPTAHPVLRMCFEVSNFNMASNAGGAHGGARRIQVEKGHFQAEKIIGNRGRVIIKGYI